MAKAKPKVLLAEDHDLVRAGFKSILDSDGTVKVIAEAQDGETTLSLIEEKQPDILIIDLSMPKLSGLAVITQLKKQKNPIKVIVLTAAEAPNVWKEVLDLGVEGLALKSVSKAELVSGIKSVIAEENFIHSEIQPSLDAYLAELEEQKVPEENTGDKPSRPKKLSVREKQVIKLVAEGYKTKDIADMLEISDRTVSKHRENIMTKLGMTASAELVNYASHIGLLKVALDEIR
ncbi:response regulator transcription factor [Hydrogenovibrio sp. 3SP14C1]|uniref:response regulator n=1 Tax=Hydrogenovibrio sp. 3SP14C1 TaxID=3038774 RepID=UPI002416927D|nr:response regulator transcription factor [Hydrogenovibrio sp. 3SP14C1]MDG4812996.1 response regulator transcription factor [Hydrogenovibrio sp. 3SP14C1]